MEGTLVLEQICKMKVSSKKIKVKQFKTSLLSLFVNLWLWLLRNEVFSN